MLSQLFQQPVNKLDSFKLRCLFFRGFLNVLDDKINLRFTEIPAFSYFELGNQEILKFYQNCLAFALELIEAHNNKEVPACCCDKKDERYLWHIDTEEICKKINKKCSLKLARIGHKQGLTNFERWCFSERSELISAMLKSLSHDKAQCLPDIIRSAKIKFIKANRHSVKKIKTMKLVIEGKEMIDTLRAGLRFALKKQFYFPACEICIGLLEDYIPYFFPQRQRLIKQHVSLFLDEWCQHATTFCVEERLKNESFIDYELIERCKWCQYREQCSAGDHLQSEARDGSKYSFKT